MGVDLSARLSAEADAGRPDSPTLGADPHHQAEAPAPDREGAGTFSSALRDASEKAHPAADRSTIPRLGATNFSRPIIGQAVSTNAVHNPTADTGTGRVASPPSATTNFSRPFQQERDPDAQLVDQHVKNLAGRLDKNIPISDRENEIRGRLAKQAGTENTAEIAGNIISQGNDFYKHAGSLPTSEELQALKAADISSQSYRTALNEIKTGALDADDAIAKYKLTPEQARQLKDAEH